MNNSIPQPWHVAIRMSTQWKVSDNLWILNEVQVYIMVTQVKSFFDILDSSSMCPMLLMKSFVIWKPMGRGERNNLNLVGLKISNRDKNRIWDLTTENTVHSSQERMFSVIFSNIRSKWNHWKMVWAIKEREISLRKVHDAEGDNKLHKIKTLKQRENQI